MSLVQDLLDRHRQLESDRSVWLQHWRDIARYALPDSERFDRMFDSGSSSVIDTVASEPIASRRGKEIYDITSLVAIDRLSSGLLSRITPSTSPWHNLRSSDPFSSEPNDDEKLWFDKLRDYLFSIRYNPASGFETNHKAALRCVCAMGTAVMWIGDSDRGRSAPISYIYLPLSENFLGVNFEGVVDTNFRMYTKSARQCVESWGNAVSAKTQAMAADPKRKDKPITILHAVYPRDEKGTYGNSNRNSPWASCTIEYDEKHLIGESGFFEFPYRIDHWQRNNPGPYSEGPMALALAEVKSLNMLSKQELTASQQWTKPPLATVDDGMGRLNLNAGAINPGYLSPNGVMLAQPIVTAQRPDFARAVIEARQNGIKDVLYVPLWQTLITENREMTAAEAMIRDRENAELLGPAGSSLQTGLAKQVDREIGILDRRGAFTRNSPLAPPESVAGLDFGPRFTSPLDNTRKLGQFQGVTQLWSFAAQIAEVAPEVLDKLNPDATVDFAQEVLGVPQSIMADDDLVAAKREARQMQENAKLGIAGAEGAGVAAQEAAAGVEAITRSPAASDILRRISGVTGQAA